MTVYISPINIQQSNDGKKYGPVLTRCITYCSPEDEKYSGCINTPHGGRNRISGSHEYIKIYS